MWHKAIWKGHPMRLELTRVGLLVELANHYTTRGAYLWPLVSCRHRTSIIRQKKKDFGETEKSKNTTKRTFTLELRITLLCVCARARVCVSVCVDYICQLLCVVVYVVVSMCVCMMIHALLSRFEVVLWIYV